MKVFRVRTLTWDYQRFLRKPDQGLTVGDIALDGTPRASDWVRPEVYVPNPLLPVGDFTRFASEGIAISEAVKETLGPLLGADCELLPIQAEGGTEFYVFNTTTCVDCLDKHRSIEVVMKGMGTSVGLHRILFEEELLPSEEHPLFIVPETRGYHLYTIERDGNPQKEFKAFVEHHRLTGLQFTLIWDSVLPDDAQPEWMKPTVPAQRWRADSIMRPIAERT